MMEWKHERVLITGGSGFLGSRLVHRLIVLGANVSVATRGEMSLDRLCDVQQHCVHVRVDLTDATSVQRAFEEIRPTAVFHLAAYGTLPGQNDAKMMDLVNVCGTQNVLAECRRFHISRIIVAGSWAEYGVSQNGGLMSEEDACLPCSEYGASKFASTNTVIEWSERMGVPVTVLRFFSVYGFGEPSHRLVPTLLASARTGVPARLGNSNVIRDFIHVEDVVDAMVCVAQRYSDACGILNVGSGTGMSIRDLADLVRRVFPNMPEPLWSNEPCRPWDVARAVADMSRMQSRCAWRATRELERFIRRMGD